MLKFILASGLALAVPMMAPAAFADHGRPALADRSAVVFVHPDFSGPQRRISGPVRNFRHLHFNDTISSLRVRGTWEVCTDPDFRGRCRVVDGSIGRLSGIRMNDNISSMRPIRIGHAGRSYDGYEDRDRRSRTQGIEGRRSVFFPDLKRGVANASEPASRRRGPFAGGGVLVGCYMRTHPGVISMTCCVRGS